MLLPTQQASATVSTTLMGSIIEDIEKRRAEEEEKTKAAKEDRVLRARIKSDEAQKTANDKINNHFFNRAVVDVTELKLKLIDRLGELVDLKRADGQSAYAYGRQLEEALADLEPEQIRTIEKTLGLDDLDLSLGEMLAAIKNPYGMEDDKLEAALQMRTQDGGMNAIETAKVLQRLEDAADPRSLEELKLERTEKDPTRIEDEETRAEREKTIRALEAQDKLDDVEELHEAVNERNRAQIGADAEVTSKTGEAIDATEVLTILAAGAEIAESQARNGGDSDERIAAKVSNAREENGAISKEEASLMAALHEDGEQEDEERAAEARELFVLHVDEDGIYDYLRRKVAGA
ncbi:hypothetical protein PYH37_002441 [Sinorhizobium numidicum]|uniref:Uncharacterized protein n=1 Tax=Sinorhizobium numidicum TaxID=680248 RepID=A0ABY8D073_9HYPH|nr:hypothetical protein [Sinorhizobium numidicum]WEX77630.1 hypothetical protein PYH37_002441 [Sinorhizobium numidicum]WEX84290.1 hypothetical protein PYH38_003154 [Sinorhizobium numidicum]